MLNVLKAVETVDDDDLKLIVQEQIDEIMINMGNSIEKYRSHVDTNQSKLRLKHYQRDLNYTTYNAPNKFKNDPSLLPISKIDIPFLIIFFFKKIFFLSFKCESIKLLIDV